MNSKAKLVVAGLSAGLAIGVAAIAVPTLVHRSDATEDDSGPAPEQDSRHLVDRVIDERIEPRFGISTRAELRAELLKTSSGPDRSRKWLLGWINDWPGEQIESTKLLEQDPLDEEAFESWFSTTRVLDGLETAMKRLNQVDLQKLHNVDKRGGGDIERVPEAICEALIRQHRFKEAGPPCEDIGRVGGDITGAMWEAARIETYEGRYEDSKKLIDRMMKIDGRIPISGFIDGIDSWHLGQKDEARDFWLGTLILDPAFTPAQQALSNPDMDVPQLLDTVFALVDRQTADSLVQCGGVYLDLDLPVPAQRCFDAADQLEPHLSDTMRIKHEVDADPKAALAHAEAMMQATHHPSLPYALALARFKTGDLAGARAALDEVMTWDIRDARTHRLYVRVCNAQHDYPCAHMHERVVRGAMLAK